MRGCELMWSVERADEVQATVEKALGDRCPCLRGMRCPVLGSLLDQLIESPPPPLAPVP